MVRYRTFQLSEGLHDAEVRLEDVVDRPGRPRHSQPVLGRRLKDLTWSNYVTLRGLSRLYRSQILQVNMRWKALPEIYTMHSFAPRWNPLAKNGEKGPGQNNPEKEENRSLISIFSSKIANLFLRLNY